MEEPPRTSKEGLFCISNVMDILFYGFTIGIICLCNFIVVLYGYGNGNLGDDCNRAFTSDCSLVFRARGALFATLTVLCLLHGITCRDLVYSTWSWNAFMRGRHNFYLYGSFVFGFILLIVVLYVPVLNHEVFKHDGISWEWGKIGFFLFLLFIYA